MVLTASSFPSAGKSLSDDQTAGPILPPPAARLPPAKALSQDCGTQCDVPTPETSGPAVSTATTAKAATSGV